MDPATIIALLTKYRYLIIFPTAIINGPIVTFLGGFLLKLNLFDFWPLYIIIMAADVTSDLAWYAVGYKWGDKFVNRYGKYFDITAEKVDKVKEIFHRHKNKFMFFSKITMGFGLALASIITAGLVKVPMKNFLFFNILGQLIWTGALLAMGYTFGSFYMAVDRGFKTISLISLAIFMILLGLGFKNYMRKNTLV